MEAPLELRDYAHPIAFVAIGDSLAFGLGASKDELGFVHRLFTLVREMRPGSTFRNYAVPHATMGDVLRHQVPKIHGVAADAVLVIAGANDLRYTRDRFVFARRFAHLLQSIRDAAPGARLIAGGMPDVAQTVGVHPLVKPAIAHLCFRLNAAMQRIASDFEAGFIDMFAYTNAPLQSNVRYLCDDGYHPNDVGYEEIAQRAFPAVAEALDLD
jgi:lysophospholipase L1-like esterase